MKFFIFFLLSGCRLEYQTIPEDQSCQNYGQTYLAEVADTDLPELVQMDETTSLLWDLNIQTREKTAQPCFQLDLYDLESQSYIENLGSWLQPSDGLIQPQVESGEYPLAYVFRGYQPGTVGLELYADQHQLGRWSVNIE